jgi:RNA polymerase sigma factor (sigma-70 family)
MTSSVERFTACWHADGPRVLAYARRHIGHDHAQEVVADTFMLAWRKWDAVPDPPIGWLIATARGVISNRRRSLQRRQALESRAALLAQVASPDPTESVIGREEALRRLARLSDEHREALLMTSWDGLTSDEAAEALNIRPATFRRRVSRARASLGDDPSPPEARGPLPTTTLSSEGIS